MTGKNKEFVNLDNARHDDQRAVMEEIAELSDRLETAHVEPEDDVHDQRRLRQ